MDGSVWWLAGAFVLGGASRLWEERWRREVLGIALTEPLRGQDSEVLTVLAARQTVFESIVTSTLLVVSPRRAMRRIRSQIAEYREEQGR
jgi:hypothetical protein